MTQTSQAVSKITGALLILGAVGTLFLMSHHPTLGTPEFHSLAEEVRGEARGNQLVHGAMIAIMLGYYFGMVLLARQVGRDRWQITLGLIFFALATAMMTLAPLMSGFLIPELAKGVAETQEGRETFRVLINMAHAMNQVFANTGVVAFGAGIALFGLALLGEEGMNRITGIAGLLVGIVLMMGMLMGHIYLDVHGMMGVAGGMGVWFALAGLLLIRAGGQAES